MNTSSRDSTSKNLGKPIQQTPRKEITSSSNAIIVNKCQKGNPILNSIQSVPWQFGETLADYQIGQTSCALFLSLKYHKLHPEYLHQRISRLGLNYCDLRVLMILCDVDDHESSIREITKICVVNKLTMVVAWSNLEISRYLQLYKSLENKSAALIKPKIEKDYLSQLNNVLTSIRGINKTDVLTLASNFGSFKQMVEAHPSQFSLCPGLGEKKVKRLTEALQSDFTTRQIKRSKPSNKTSTSLTSQGDVSKISVRNDEETNLNRNNSKDDNNQNGNVDFNIDDLEVFDLDNSEIQNLNDGDEDKEEDLSKID